MLRIGWESLYYSVRSLLTNHTVIFFKLTSFSCLSPALSPPGSTEEGKTLSVLLLEHKEDLIRCVTQLRPILEFLETVEEEFLPGSEKRVTVQCLLLPPELMWHLFLSLSCGTEHLSPCSISSHATRKAPWSSGSYFMPPVSPASLDARTDGSPCSDSVRFWLCNSCPQKS